MATSRRHFLGATAVGAGLASEMLAESPQNTSPNDRVHVALIGNGIQGYGDARANLATGMTEIVAVSDVYEGRLTRGKEAFGNQIFTTRDYREILARNAAKLMGSLRDLRPGMQGLMPFASKASLNQSAS